jgi:hypothetical protein
MSDPFFCDQCNDWVDHLPNSSECPNKRKNEMKKIIILRSVSSAGKSTFANYIASLDPTTVICCADDYFYIDGEYRFDSSKLGVAHGACKEKFKKAIDNNVKTIIIANTNTKEKEFAYYEEYAKGTGYMVISLVIEKRHENKNSHNVPQETLDKQELNIRNSLKLQ